MKLRVYVVELEMSPRARRLAKHVFVGMTIALVVGIGAAVARASVPKTWLDRDVLTADDLNGNFAALDARITALAGQVSAAGGNLSAYSYQSLASTWTGGENSFSDHWTLGYAVPTDGTYRVSAQATLSSTGSHATAYLKHNTTQISFGMMGDTGRYHTISLSPIGIHLAAGDAIDLYTSCSGGSWAYVHGDDQFAGGTHLLVEKLY